MNYFKCSLLAFLALAACGPTDEGLFEFAEGWVGPSSIELQSNTIRGTYRLTNENPEILAVLDSIPADQRWAFVIATSSSPTGYAGNTSSLNSTVRQFDFEMSVEAGAGGDNGVTYALRGMTNRASNNHGGYVIYPFASVTGVQVQPRSVQPAPTEVNVQECAGVIRFIWGTDDSCSTRVLPKSAGIPGGRGLYFTEAGGHLFVPAGQPGPSRIVYQVGGANYDLAIEHPWVAQCDQVWQICTKVDPPWELGGLTGPWDVPTEQVIAKPLIIVHDGPVWNGRTLNAPELRAPVAEPAKWWTAGGLPAGNYWVRSGGSLRRGREFTGFGTTDVPATIVTGQILPVSKIVDGRVLYPFVMQPAYLEGSLRLTDPYVAANPGATSTLQSLFFEADHDSNGDGIPNYPGFGGLGERPPRPNTQLSAQVSAAGSSTSFAHTFDASTSELSSGYEQLLLDAYDTPQKWLQFLQLGFWTFGSTSKIKPSDPGYDPVRFRYGWLQLRQQRTWQVLSPGQRDRVDHEYCFNEVQLQYTSEVTRLYNPLVNLTGKFIGTDWRGATANYTVGGRFYGTPAVWGPPTSEAITYSQRAGSISFAVPQGSYTLAPGATMVNSDGTVTDATFQPIQVTLGCGQRLKLVPPLTVLLDPQSECAIGPATTVSGRVRSSPAVVDRIWYRVGDGPEITVCTHCGVDPTFNFVAPLGACLNTVKVFAYTEGMPEAAEGFQQIVWDDPADGPSCPGTTCVNRPPVARCTNRVVSAAAACRGDASVNDGSYDPDGGDVTCVQTPEGPYALGRNRVTLECTDGQGLKASCDATVTVRDDSPPVLTCPSAPALQCTNGGAVASYSPAASDRCSLVTTACTPAAGSTFPLGTTGVTCTATDAAGNQARCSFPVVVEDTQPPSIACPAPATAECTGNGGAMVTLGPAMATDSCTEASVSGPGPAWYPVGTTPVTFTATDTSGNPASCTTSVTVTDSAPPAVEVTGLGGIWPPDHELRTVRLDECGIVVRDGCSGTAVPSAARITCVSSDEPLNDRGDGSTAPDIVMVDARTVMLRAERQGSGDGRVYRIHFTVDDGHGNQSEAVCVAAVPHDLRGGAPGEDSGEAYRVCR